MPLLRPSDLAHTSQKATTVTEAPETDGINVHRICRWDHLCHVNALAMMSRQAAPRHLVPTSMMSFAWLLIALIWLWKLETGRS